MVKEREEPVLSKKTENMRVQLQDNTERDKTMRGVATVASVSQFLLTLITKRLYKDLAEQKLRGSSGISGASTTNSAMIECFGE